MINGRRVVFNKWKKDELPSEGMGGGLERRKEVVEEKKGRLKKKRMK